MFLFEDGHHAVLYTGDIRSEPWFVNNLRRNPLLLEYTSGKKLDCIYLDTSFTSPMKFPTKADGLKELVKKVSRYPSDTVFHFAAWTFGYEEVWILLSKALKSRFHVTNYTYDLYNSLIKHPAKAGNDQGPAIFAAPEAAVLSGYTVGNNHYSGILTTDENVRLHSCEKGLRCKVIKGSQVVWIRPIIARTPSGQEVSEMGIGGGGGDLLKRQELQLDRPSIDELVRLFAEQHPGRSMNEIKKLLLSENRSNIVLNDEREEPDEMEPMVLEQLYRKLSKRLQDSHMELTASDPERADGLPSTITFPYSRHSSYEELCDLVQAFRPMEVWPCTVDECNWHEDDSMRSLFGEFCTGSNFRHDSRMRGLLLDNIALNEYQDKRTQSTDCSDNDEDSDGDQQQEQSFSNHEPLYTLRTINGRKSLYDAEGKEKPALQKIPAISANFSVAEPVAPIGGQAQAIENEKIPNDDIHDVQVNESGDISEREVNELHIAGGLHLINDSGERVNRSSGTTAHAGDEPNQDIIDLNSDIQASPVNSQRRFASGEPEEPLRNKRRRLDNSDHYELESSDEESSDQDDLESEHNINFWDPQDLVHRCKICGWEWDRLNGKCFHFSCEARSKKVRGMWEVAEPIAWTHSASWSWQEVLDEDVDDAVEAYASESEDENADYEMNSMIDDASIRSHSVVVGESQDDDDGEDDQDYEEMHQLISARYSSLQNEVDEVYEMFREYRHEMDDFSSDDELDMDDSEDSIPFAMVDVETKDPPLTEVLVSSTYENHKLTGDSQASVLSRGRLADREAAYDAALDFDNGWDRSLMSVNDNHTKAEVEL